MPRSFLPRESDEQRTVVDWCKLMGVGVFAVPNGVKLVGPWRHAQVQRAKQTGMLPGAPDLVLIDLAPLTRQPVAVEVKRAKQGRVSEAQEQVHALMRAAGWLIIVARGANEAIEKLRALGYGARLPKRGNHESAWNISEGKRTLDQRARDDR